MRYSLDDVFDRAVDEIFVNEMLALFGEVILGPQYAT
jgi:hypothetical protein